MRKGRSSILIAGIMLAVTTLSCDRNTLFSDNYRIDDRQWSMYDPARYTCTIGDTVSTFNIDLSVRTSTDYPYRNMYLFIVTTFPSGTIVTDTLQAMITDERGKWLGRGAGDLRELTIPYKTNVFFPEEGEYHFSVIHGMRDTLLKGVYDMAMTISLKEDKGR
ncbi:MAG: gliding motility lipoprotein GldH [Bacteroidales bacterium]|jgi:gliding motility-associated lipoprotein GldH|nr:gliding motility lipoprotein GldH [Bacteroidales bacterium]